MRHHSLSRREVLASAAAILPLAGCASAPSASSESTAARIPVPEPVGVQLYTVRSLLPEKAEATIQALATIGYKQCELGRADLERIVPLCRAAGITPVSGHFEYACITGDWTNYGGKPPRAGYNLEAALDDAKNAGLRYITVPYINQAERTGADLFPRLAENLNRAGEDAAKMGMKVAYHNHAFEFEKFGEKTGFELLMENLDGENAFLELDVYWVATAGDDPVAVMEKYPRHIKLMHLKDRKAGAPVMQSEAVPRDTFLELGKGTMDLPAILTKAKAVGVEHFFVEQDQTPGDPVESLRTSFAYLAGLKSAG